MNLASKLAAAKAKSSAVSTVKPVPAKTGILSHDKYQPGDLISSDQYVVKTLGRLQKGYGREALHNCYHGGTIFQYAASNLHSLVCPERKNYFHSVQSKQVQKSLYQ